MCGLSSYLHRGLRFRTRGARGLAVWASVALLALAFAGPANAVGTVDLGNAAEYSVLAGVSVTSTGPTAMSENLGVSPQSTLAGTPIVLGDTHLADGDAAAAQSSLNHAYADAVLRPSTLLTTGDFIGQTYTTGVYGTPAAIGFSGGTLTLDAEGDPDAVFIFQIGGALTVAASTIVALVNGAQACNVFWAVGGAVTIGASARFSGTIMASTAITVGANTRMDGRLLAEDGAITLAENAIRTAACTAPPVVLTGPAGPAGPAGPTGPAGAIGADGPRGTNGTDGAAGLRGASGADGTAGASGVNGTQGIAGLTGANGLVGATGVTGAEGAVGTNGAAGLQGMTGAAGLQGASGAAGAHGLAGVMGADGLVGLTGLMGADGVAGPTGRAGQDGAVGSAGRDGKDGSAGSTAPAQPIGVVISVPVAQTTTLCVTDTAGKRAVRRGELVTWRIVVRNCGEHAASGVTVSDRLRTGASLTTRHGGSLVSGQLRWKTGALAIGAHRTYRVVARIALHAPTGAYANRARASGTNAEAATGQGSTTVVGLAARPARATGLRHV